MKIETSENERKVTIQYEIKTVDHIYTVICYSDNTSEIIETPI
jgi:hypothetical protein